MMRTRILFSLAVILVLLLSASMVSADMKGGAAACVFSPGDAKRACERVSGQPAAGGPSEAEVEVEDAQAETADEQAEASGARAPDERTVKTIGRNILRPNRLIASTLRFSPGKIRVSSGGNVTWVHADQTGEPHTATIVNQSELPQTFEDFVNPDFCPTCNAALEAHFGTEEEPIDPPQIVVDVGEEGLDQPGDSLLFFAGEEISATVSISAGTTLYYLCAIHPWMQGQIRVR